MPFLEIVHFTGEVDRREVTKQAPVSIGKHASNDIVIDDNSVEIMHCRISWNKHRFEAVAAGLSPIEVNGTERQRAVLNPGDTLRFGAVDVRFLENLEDDPDLQRTLAEGKSPSLKPISTDGLPAERPPVGAFVQKPATPVPQSPKPAPLETRKPATSVRPPVIASPKPAAPPSPKPPAEQVAEEVDFSPVPGSFQDALDAIVLESRTNWPTTPPGAGAAGPPEFVSPASENADPSSASVPQPREQAEVVRKDELSPKMRKALRTQQLRPGEEDPLRSPLVLGLAGGTLVLLLAGAIFYFAGTRQTAEKQFDVAKQSYDSGNLVGSITEFQKFLEDHPRGAFTSEAQKLVGLARVRQHTEGGKPDFAEGLTQLRAFVDEQRDLEGFSELTPEICLLAKNISLNAATAAGKQSNLKLLEISRDARTLLTIYSPKDAPPTESLDQIESTLRASESAILRDDVYKVSVAKIDASIKAGAPLEALKLRRNLVLRYPDLERDKSVLERVQQALQTEKEKVVATDFNRPVFQDDRDWPNKQVTLAFHSRIRTDEVAVGKAVILLAQDCCYGVEFATGQPLWRRPVGFDLPFFPLLDDELSSLILFDTRNQELIQLQQHTGQLVWRLPLQEQVTGKPLLTSEALYVTTQSGRLLSIDVASGRITGGLQFPQPVSGPVLLEDTQRIAVVGNEEVVYTLTKRPFACQLVMDLGHAPGSVKASLLTMAAYVLIIENGVNHAILHLLQSGGGQSPLISVARVQSQGRVVDTPVIRGRDLFVPSVGGRVSAFSLSDDPGQPPLTAGPVYQGDRSYQGPTFLLTGPDRQLWMATGALTRLRLTTDSLQPDGKPVAFGVATQPLQFISGYLFNARRRTYSTGVTFTRTDRDELSSDWQVVLGSRISAWSSRPGQVLSLIAVNDAGQIFRVGDKQFTDRRFLNEASSSLSLHQDLAEPLLAARLPNQRLAVACGGVEPRLWIINSTGQTESSTLLPSAPQAAPATIQNDVIVPLAGKLLVPRQSNLPAVQEFSLASDDKQAWVSVTPVSSQQAVALTAEGLIVLIRMNDLPRPHLSEIARLTLDQRVVHPAGAGDGLYAVADRSERVSLFDGERLDPRGSRTFALGVSNRPLIAGGKLFVEEAGTKLHCLEPAGELPITWSIDLPNSSVTGVIKQGEQFVVALRNGKVLFVDAATGQVLKNLDTDTPLSLGPLPIPGGLCLGANDGTLIDLSAEGDAP